MKDLEWTDEPPKVKGIFLYRRDPNSEARGCKVEEHQQGRLIMYLTGYEVPIPVQFTKEGSQWAGPIPEPE